MKRKSLVKYTVWQMNEHMFTPNKAMRALRIKIFFSEDGLNYEASYFQRIQRAR